MAAELSVVMFTDQVRFTSNTQQRTHAEVTAIAREQVDLTVEVLRITGGTMIKDTGDGCFARFSSVVEAVQAGLLLQQRVAERNLAQSNPMMQFELHIGIDAGELVVLSNGDLHGEAANRCARICADCPPGKVYLSDMAAALLKSNEVDLAEVGEMKLRGIDRRTRVYSAINVSVPQHKTANPFIWRAGVGKSEDFFNRTKEIGLVHAYLNGRQGCQVVDHLRLGKTALLQHVTRQIFSWDSKTAVAYLDLQDPRCYTLSGWLNHASRQFNWSKSAADLVEFVERTEEMVSKHVYSVLCLDNFEELTIRADQFNRNFFLALRASSGMGLSIITASQSPLSTLPNLDDPTSPFYNILPMIKLAPFTDADAQQFITKYRVGVPHFATDEIDAIKKLAKGHPLALQVGCFHVLLAKQHGDSLATAIQRARYDIRNNLRPKQ